MAKKYLSLERLTEYDELIKGVIDARDDSVKSYVDTEVAKKASSSHTHAISDVSNLQSTLDAKATQSSLNSHTGNTDIHVTTTNKSNWNSAYTHSTSAHAPSNAERNIIVGIQKNGTDLTVDSSTRKVNVTVPTVASDIGASPSNHNHDDKYDAKNSASNALATAKTYSDGNLAIAKSYADGKISALLDGANDTTLDSIKELADAIKENDSAIDALNNIASGKADATHGHSISDVSGLQSALDSKAAASHGTHVSFDSTNTPKMNGNAAFGTSSKVARADHVHPTDTSRASQVDLDALEEVVSSKANSSHTHAISDVTNLQSSLDTKATTSALNTHTNNADIHFTAAERTKLSGIATGATKVTVDSALNSSSTNPVQNKVVNSAITTATSAISTNASSISTHTTQISALQTAVSEIQEITSAEISALFT